MEATQSGVGDEDVAALHEVHHLDEEGTGVARRLLEDLAERSSGAHPELVGVDRQHPVGPLKRGQPGHPRHPLGLVHRAHLARELNGQVRAQVRERSRSSRRWSRCR